MSKTSKYQLLGAAELALWFRAWRVALPEDLSLVPVPMLAFHNNLCLKLHKGIMPLASHWRHLHSRTHIHTHTYIHIGKDNKKNKTNYLATVVNISSNSVSYICSHNCILFLDPRVISKLLHSGPTTGGHYFIFTFIAMLWNSMFFSFPLLCPRPERNNFKGRKILFWLVAKRFHTKVGWSHFGMGQGKGGGECVVETAHLKLRKWKAQRGISFLELDSTSKTFHQAQ